MNAPRDRGILFKYIILTIKQKTTPEEGSFLLRSSAITLLLRLQLPVAPERLPEYEGLSCQ